MNHDDLVSTPKFSQCVRISRKRPNARRPSQEFEGLCLLEGLAQMTPEMNANREVEHGAAEGEEENDVDDDKDDFC